MSGSTAKEDRRAIRRAFGDVAIQTLNNQRDRILKVEDETREALAQVQTTQGYHRQQIADLEQQQDALQARLASLAGDVHEWRYASTFWARLRWIVRGW